MSSALGTEPLDPTAQLLWRQVLREVQEVWPGVAPYVDAKVTSGAHRLRLPADRESLAGLLAASGQPARLAAALVRVSLSQRAASEVTASVRD